MGPASTRLSSRGNHSRRSFIQAGKIGDRIDVIEYYRQALQIGTDSALPGLYPGKAVHRELTELVKAGLSNYDALATGTTNAGEFIRKYIDADAKVGQVATGFRADLLLLDGNPLDDVRNARRIAGVTVNGRYMNWSSIHAIRQERKARYQ